MVAAASDFNLHDPSNPKKLKHVPSFTLWIDCPVAHQAVATRIKSLEEEQRELVEYQQLEPTRQEFLAVGVFG